MTSKISNIRLNKQQINGVIYLLGNIFNKAIPFLLVPIFTRAVSVDSFGHLNIFEVFLAFTYSIIGMSAQNFIDKKYYVLEEEQKHKLYFNLFLFFTLNYLLFLVLGSLLYTKLIWGLEGDVLVLFIVISSSYLLTLIDSSLTIMRYQGKAINYAFFHSLRPLIAVLLAVVFLLYLGFDWQSRAYGVVISNFICAFFAILIVLKPINLNKSLILDLKIIKAIYKFALPLMLYSLSAIVINLSDRLIISQLLDIESVAYYSVSYTISMSILIVSNSFFNVFTPWFFKNAESNLAQIKRILKYYISVNLLFIIGLCVFRDLITEILTGDNNTYNLYGDLILIIAPGFFVYSFYQILHPIAIHQNKNNYLMIASATGAILNIILNYKLIPSYGLYGAGAATLLSYIAMSSLLLIMLTKTRYYKLFTSSSC